MVELKYNFNELKLYILYALVLIYYMIVPCAKEFLKGKLIGKVLCFPRVVAEFKPL